MIGRREEKHSSSVTPAGGDRVAGELPTPYFAYKEEIHVPSRVSP